MQKCLLVLPPQTPPGERFRALPLSRLTASAVSLRRCKAMRVCMGLSDGTVRCFSVFRSWPPFVYTEPSVNRDERHINGDGVVDIRRNVPRFGCGLFLKDCAQRICAENLVRESHHNQ